MSTIYIFMLFAGSADLIKFTWKTDPNNGKFSVVPGTGGGHCSIL